MKGTRSELEDQGLRVGKVFPEESKRESQEQPEPLLVVLEDSVKERSSSVVARDESEVEEWTEAIPEPIYSEEP